MASLADIVRKQRSGGSGPSGALFSAVGMKVLETIDPRRMFNRSGLLTALFPSLKSYRAGGATENKVSTASSVLSTSSAPLLQEMIVKLDALSSISKITARNSQTLPGMSRDMNVMRQNIVKLVRLQGGKAATRADAFFSRAAERERMTEAQLAASKSTTPTPSVERKTESGLNLGMLAMLGSGITVAFKAISSLGSSLIKSIGSLTSVLTPLLKGGLSLIFDVAGSFAKLAVQGGAGLLSFAGKGLGTLLRGVAGFLLNPAVLGSLGVGAIAWLLTYLFTNEKTQYGDSKTGSMTQDQGLGDPTSGNSADASAPIPSGGYADVANEEALARVRARNTSPTPTSSATDTGEIPGVTTTKTPTRAPNKSVTPGEDGKLLDFIAAKESGGDYNAVYGQGSVPGLTDMTIAQVLEYQKQLIANGQKSSAVGRYQFIASTLAEEAKAAGVDIEKEKFTPEMQDKLILHRLKRVRGLDKFRQGKLDATQFAENLSKEFASLPSPIKGEGTKSYYEGIAGNKSLTSMENVYAAITPKTSSTQLAQATEESSSLSNPFAFGEQLASSLIYNDNKVVGGGSSAPIISVDKATPYDRNFYNGVLNKQAL